MTRGRLKAYRKYVKELSLINRTIEELEDEWRQMPRYTDKVTGSGQEYPYLSERSDVESRDMEQVTAIRATLEEKEKRKRYLEGETREIKAFVNAMPDGLGKEIIELVYIQGESQEAVGESLGYTQARVSQIIRDALKDL